METSYVLKYSVERLNHFVCWCGQTWTISGELPQAVACPGCMSFHSQFEEITQTLKYCKQHEIWYYTDLCPMPNHDTQEPVFEFVGFGKA